MKLTARISRSKLDPRLRKFVDGDYEVNLRRAQQSGAVRVITPSSRPLLSLDEAMADASLELGTADVPDVSPPGALADGVQMSVFVDLKEGVTASELGVPCEVRGTQAIAQVTRAQLAALRIRRDVTHIEAGDSLIPPNPLEEESEDDTDAPPTPRRVDTSVDHRGGGNILIGIIDVGGFDFAHQDFVVDGKTRFVRIWDQGAEGVRIAPVARNRAANDNPFAYGAEFRWEHLNRSIEVSRELGVPPHEIERQSQRERGSHATHVASIAAGNTGVCPAAKLAGVTIALTRDDMARQRSFYDSSRVVHALEYLFQVAEEEGCSAVSVNISLGTNGHAHDGSDPMSRWIDAALVSSGRAVTVAAGNAGQEKPARDGDIGFVTGRIHTSGKFESAGQSRTIEVQVVGNTIEDISENEIEVWYSNRDRFDVEVFAPGDDEAIARVRPGEEIDNQQLQPDGTFIGIYNQLYHSANGDNRITVYLSPYLSEAKVRGVRPGIWRVVLHAVEVRDGGYHGWIERDDPGPVVDDGPVRLWRFPAFFHADSNDDQRSISSLGCGDRITCVTNLDADSGQMHISTSQGPTRDGRQKPDVAAPGSRILAANGFDSDRAWIRKTGTSMASPFVCGVAGLMLAVNPRLTAAQIVGILQRTANPLTADDFNWRTDSCFGRIDPIAAIDEAAAIRFTTEG